MSNPWFRFYKEFMTDPVVQSMAFEDQRHYTILLCLKCDGVLDRKIKPAARERIILRGLGLDSITGDEVKRRLIEVDLISKNWQPKGWNKRQFISDNSTERSRKSRKSKEPSNVAATPSQHSCNAPDTESETDTYTDKPKIKRKAFAKPTANEVHSYCLHKEINGIDSEAFIDFYESKGWMVGKNKMKDWKACVRTWAKRNKEKGNGRENGTHRQDSRAKRVSDKLKERAMREDTGQVDSSDIPTVSGDLLT